MAKESESTATTVDALANAMDADAAEAAQFNANERRVMLSIYQGFLTKPEPLNPEDSTTLREIVSTLGITPDRLRRDRSIVRAALVEAELMKEDETARLAVGAAVRARMEGERRREAEIKAEWLAERAARAKAVRCSTTAIDNLSKLAKERPEFFDSASDPPRLNRQFQTCCRQTVAAEEIDEHAAACIPLQAQQ